VQLVIRIRNNDGGTIELTAPTGATVEIAQDGRTFATVPSPASYGSLRRYEGHAGYVIGVVFLSGDKQFLSAGYDGTLRVWDVVSGNVVRQWKGHDAEIISLDISKNGRLALTAARDRTVRLWDVESGDELNRFEKKSADVFVAALSRDGRKAVIGGENLESKKHQMWLWDPNTGEDLGTFEGHEHRVVALSISEDGNRVLSGSQDFTMLLWSIESRQELQRFEGHETWVWCVGFSPDGRLAASGSGTQNLDANGRPIDCLVRLWDAQKGMELSRIQAHSDVRALCFLPSGNRLLYGGTDRNLYLSEIGSQREIARFVGHRHTVQRVAISSDGRQALSASHDGTLRLWALPPEQVIQKK
jgi:WD40 repeat protein